MLSPVPTRDSSGTRSRSRLRRSLTDSGAGIGPSLARATLARVRTLFRMRIESVQSRLYRIPPTVRWEDSTHHVSALEYVVSEVTTDTDIVGTGISYTTGVGGSAIVALVDDYCAAMLRGESPFAVGQVWSFLEKQLRRNGSGVVHLALAAVDTALWDIVGKAVGQPLHGLLGTCHERVPVYGSGIDLFLEED